MTIKTAINLNLNPKDRAKEQLRRYKKIVALREEGKTNKEVAEIVDYHHTYVCDIWQRYKKGGFEAIAPKKRGPVNVPDRKLTQAQEKMIKKVLLQKTPDKLRKLKLGLQLWTRDAVSKLILQKFNIAINERTLVDYFKRWGITYHNPHNIKDHPVSDVYRRWYENDYPKILAETKDDGVEIHWVDCSSKREGDSFVKIISAKSNQGQVRFLLLQVNPSSDIFIDFMKRLISDSNRKILLILYKDKVCRSDSVNSWLDTKKLKIDVLYIEDCFSYPKP